MKVALQISGELRSFKSYYTNYKQQILDNVKPDIFLSTWNNLLHQRIPNEGTLKEYVDLYNPIAYEYENFCDKYLNSSGINNVINIVKNKPKIHTYRDCKNIIYMFYKRFRCNKIFEEYCNLNNKQYDVVIVTRTDLIFCEPLLIEQVKLAKNQLLIPMGADFENGICDIFVMGPPDLINVYCSLYNYIEKYVEKNTMFHPEHLLKYHLEDNGIPFKRNSFHIQINTRRMT